jgi:hypothetical protein
MTDWLAILQRAAYTRFCKTGSLEPFLLARADLQALARQASGLPELEMPEGALVRVNVPVETIGRGVFVPVDEWQPGPAVISSGHGTS